MAERAKPSAFADVVPTLLLAGPIALGQVGIMLMGIVDTAMVGGLGPRAVGAVGVGTTLFSSMFVAGLGLLLGIDRLAAVAYGAGREGECRRIFLHGARIALVTSIPLTILLNVVADHLADLGTTPSLVPEAALYTKVLSWSLLPSLLFSALRQTLQATGRASPATAVLLSANVVNVVANQVLIYGLGPIPALGMVGSAWATLAARLFMLVALAVYAWRIGVIGRPEAGDGNNKLTWDLLRLGLPASGQMMLEVGVFATATMLAASLGEVQAAAHQIVLVIASFTFMVPLGTGSAGAVRVAQAAGRGDHAGSTRAGWTAVAMGVGFMALSSITLLVLPGPILGFFSHDEATTTLAARLLICAGLFQLFDGAQVTLGGVLRGSGETVAPMIANLVGHWFIGLPIGYFLCYRQGLGVFGLWVGLSAGLASVAIVLTMVWKRRMTVLEAQAPAAA